MLPPSSTLLFVIVTVVGLPYLVNGFVQPNHHNRHNHNRNVVPLVIPTLQQREEGRQQQRVLQQLENQNCFLQRQQKQRSICNPSGPLWYRQLDDKDDETTMLKLQTKCPFGYNMRRNLRQLSPNALNNSLIKALLFNQAIILGAGTLIAFAIYFSTDGFEGLLEIDNVIPWSDPSDAIIDFTSILDRIAFGIAGAILPLFVGTLIESSDRRVLANVNFSTVTMVMTLFGRRTNPPEDFKPIKYKGKLMPTTSNLVALLQSFLLATVTGICEEIVFRFEIPALLAFYFGGYPFVPVVGQAILFGLGHTSPGSSIRENGLLVALQGFNGLCFGLIYVLSGGDLLPCIVAHALYDVVVFFKTWFDANAQIEYAESMFMEPLPEQDQEDVNAILESTYIEPKVFKAVKRLFYTFDFDKNKTLSKSEVRKGFSYLALEKAGVPPLEANVDALFDQYTSNAAKTRLTFTDFLRLYTESGSNPFG